VKMTDAEHLALEAFVASVRRHYGPRLVDIVVFGSRARGDATEESDIDIALILHDGDWTLWAEKQQLADFIHDALVEHEFYIQAWPVRHSEWLEPSKGANAKFIEAIRTDARPWAEAI
jgi:uncharacterized protein